MNVILKLLKILRPYSLSLYKSQQVANLSKVELSQSGFKFQGCRHKLNAKLEMFNLKKTTIKVTGAEKIQCQMAITMITKKPLSSSLKL